MVERAAESASAEVRGAIRERISAADLDRPFTGERYEAFRTLLRSSVSDRARALASSARSAASATPVCASPSTTSAWARGPSPTSGRCRWRELVAEACPYANICEQCENFVTTPEFVPALQAQLADVTALRDDANARGWVSEAARHERVIASIEAQLRRLKEVG